MKKILLSAVAIMAFGFANAQETTSTGFSKGNVFISGSLGYTSTKTDDVKSSTFTFSPTVGYFITENIAIGGALSYGSSKNEGGVAESESSNFGISALGRYYFTPASTFSIYGQAQIGYTTSKTEPDGGGEFKENGFHIGVGPGMSYFVSEHFAIEAGFGILRYSSTKPDFDGAESTDTLDFNLDLSDINFGLVYKF